MDVCHWRSIKVSVNYNRHYEKSVVFFPSYSFPPSNLKDSVLCDKEDFEIHAYNGWFEVLNWDKYQVDFNIPRPILVSSLNVGKRFAKSVPLISVKISIGVEGKKKGDVRGGGGGEASEAKRRICPHPYHVKPVLRLVLSWFHPRVQQSNRSTRKQRVLNSLLPLELRWL